MPERRMQVRGTAGGLPIHGKIKAGVKGGTTGRKAIDTWRFHSPDRGAIERIASAYGGTVKPMRDPKANPPDQWEVTSTTNLIRVWLPQNAIKVAEFELRDKQGKLVRRCDGAEAHIYSTGWDPELKDCICNFNQRRECMPTVMLDVIIPEVAPFRGVWRFITHSWYALDEIPAMEEIIHQMQEMGIAEAGLILNSRTKLDGQTKKVFKVAGLQTWGEHTIEELMKGAGRPAALSTGMGPTPQALTMGTTNDGPGDEDDDEVIDAELISEQDMLISFCDAIAFNQSMPMAGAQLLLFIGRSLFPPERSGSSRSSPTSSGSGSPLPCAGSTTAR